jgi:hypothetical protein
MAIGTTSSWFRDLRVGWLTGALATGALAVMAVLWYPQTTTSFQINGLTRQITTHPNAPYQFNNTSTNTGTIAIKGKWSVKTQGHTSFALAKKVPGQQDLYLKQGQVNVHVVPNTMKRFAVHANGFTVLVKGTRFTVQRGNTWVRTEVWRGRVVLRKHNNLQRPITKGQGCRAEGKVITCYTLPPASHKLPKQRVAWLAKHQPNELVQYTKDLLTSELSSTQSTSILRQSIEHLRTAAHHKQALTLYLLLANQNVPDSNQALLDAALLCKNNKHTDSNTCQTILKQCLRECSNPLWREQSVALLLRTRSPLAKTKGEHREMMTQLKLYLSTYPKGNWRKVVGRLLVRHGTHLQQSCKMLRSYLQQNDKGEAWFRSRCR